MTAERLYRLCDTVMAPGGARAILRWRPFSVAAFRLVGGLADAGWSFATVIDAGANAGQFARAALGRWPGAVVIAFEPQSAVAERLAATLAPLGHVEVHAVALGATDGTTPFFVHRHNLSSSALPVAEAARPLPWAAELAPVTVPMARLDTALAGRELTPPCLLKLDVQGSELEVIRGAPETLSRVDALLVETAFEPGYVSQPAFAEVHQALLDLGWVLTEPLDFRRERDRRIVEADMLYRRADRPRSDGNERL